jgi:hypothetical protein
MFLQKTGKIMGYILIYFAQSGGWSFGDGKNTVEVL